VHAVFTIGAKEKAILRTAGGTTLVCLMTSLSFRFHAAAARAALSLSATAALTTTLAACGGTVHTTANGDASDAAPPPQPLRLCAFDASPAAARTVLAVRTAGKLVFVRSDGSQITVRDSLPDSYGALLANADHVFLSGTYPTDQTTLEASHQMLFDATGAALWERDESPGTAITFPAMNNQSFVVESAEQTGTSDQVLALGLREVSAGGASSFFSGFYAVAAAAEDGTVQVQSRNATTGAADAAGWLHPDGSFHPLSAMPADPSRSTNLAVDGTRFVYLDGDGTHLVVETQTDRRTIALPAAIPTDPMGLTPRQVLLRGRWAVAGDFRVDLDTATVETIAAPANGLRPFAPSCSGAQRAVDDDGSLLEALRDDSVGGVYRSSDMGKTWTPVSAAARASELGSSPFRGTYLVRAADTYCGDWNWPQTPAGSAVALTDGVSQITRPALGRQRVFTLDAGLSPVVTSDGLCAAYTRSLPADAGSLAGSTMLEVWDLQTDRTIDLLVASPSDYPVLLTWLEAEPAAGR
jgi:hypothetical protein